MPSMETGVPSRARPTQSPSAQCHPRPGGSGNATTSLSLKILPILLVELQHHVVRGHAEGPPRLVVLPAIGVVHVRRGHGAVVGVVVDVHGAAVVARHVELDVWGGRERMGWGGTLGCVPAGRGGMGGIGTAAMLKAFRSIPGLTAVMSLA